MRLLLVFFLSSYSFSVFADTCLETTVVVTPPAIPDFVGAEDNFPIGEQLSSLAASKAQSGIVNCNNVANLLASARLYPKLTDSGVTWSFMGRSFPVYKTTIPGIGLAIGFKDGKAVNWIPLDRPYAAVFPAEGTANYPIKTLGGEIKVWYISLGGLKSGVYTMPDTLVAQLTAHEESGGTLNWVDMILSGTTLTVEAKGCELQSNAVGVELGQFAVADFNGVGSSTRAKKFSIAMDCDPDIQVNLNVANSNAVSGAAGVVGLTADEESATGVGIQIMKEDGVPISLGQDEEMLISTEGLNNINLQARYFQVDEKVVPGAANAVANFTIRYK